MFREYSPSLTLQLRIHPVFGKGDISNQAGAAAVQFLPRVKDGLSGYYPYLSDEAMRDLQWVARSYSGELPVFTPEPRRLMKGDLVRITEGRFKGAEACVVIQPGAGQKSVVVCVENWMWVPLLHVRPGQYEVISLNSEGRHVYTRQDNDRLMLGLHSALERHYGSQGVTENDRLLAAETVKQYGNLQMESDVLCCKLYSMSLLTHTILGAEEQCGELLGTIRSLLSSERYGEWYREQINEFM